MRGHTITATHTPQTTHNPLCQPPEADKPPRKAHTHSATQTRTAHRRPTRHPHHKHTTTRMAPQGVHPHAETGSPSTEGSPTAQPGSLPTWGGQPNHAERGFPQGGFPANHNNVHLFVAIFAEFCRRSSYSQGIPSSGG